jgi:RecA/RadA recombinase
VRDAQRRQCNVFWLDTEGKLDPALAEANGIDPDHGITYFEPRTIENAVTLILEALRSREFPLIVLDSLGAGTSSTSAAKEIGMSTVANRARIWTLLAEQGKYLISEANACLILTNQVREVISQGGFSSWAGPSQKKTGGNAIGHESSIILKMARGSKIDDKARKGFKMFATIENNCLGPMNKRVQFDLITDPAIGIDTASSLLDIALAQGLVMQSGAWFYAPFLHVDYVTELKSLLDAGKLEPGKVKDVIKTQGRESMWERFQDFAVQQLVYKFIDGLTGVPITSSFTGESAEVDGTPMPDIADLIDSVLE